MMTPTRKSGRQPKLSARLKDFLYENDMDKIKESTPRVADKKKTEVKKEPVAQSAEKKKVPQAKKGSENSTYDEQLLSKELKLAAEALQKSPGKKKAATESETISTKGGAETKPTKAGSETKPTKAGSETKPTKAGSETKPTKAGSETKPTKAGSETKPTKAGSEMKPTKAGAEIKPTKAGAEMKPTKARAAMKPTKARAAMKPTKGGAAMKPAKGGAAMKPAKAGAEMKPAKGGAEMKPIKGGSEMKPTKVGSEIKPTKSGPEIKSTKAGPPAAKKEPAKISTVKKALQEPKGPVENKKIAQTVKPLKKDTSEITKSAQVVKAVKKEPEVQVGEKRKISEVTQESPDSSAPSRKSKRTPKPSVKLQEFVYEDEREKSVEASPVKKEPKSAEKSKINFLIEEDWSEKLGSPSKVFLEPRVTLSRLSTPESDMDVLTSPRARVANLTSISVKKGKMAVRRSQLTVKKGKLGKVMSKSPLSSVRVKHIKTGKNEVKPAPAIANKKVFVSSNSATMRKVNLLNKSVKRKGAPEITTKTKKNIKIDTELAKSPGKGNKMITKKSVNTKEVKKVEKKEIEKVLQVNKEVMTQLLNFGAEVAEAMACNNESIFSFSTKDNPLQTFKIDKQDDFSNEEVVKIIKWFEEEEEQRRAYRKRILEALRASHETNMSLYTQMLKMLQSVTAS